MNEIEKNLNVYYPVEAFALAMILFSKGMKTAMIVGIGLMFGDILLYVLHENFGERYKQAIGGIGILFTAGSLAYSFQYVGNTLDAKTLVAFAVLGILLVKHHEDAKENVPDYNKILFSDSIAYLLMVVLAVIREFIAGGAVFGIKLTKLGFMTNAYGKVMMALVFAGIAIGIINAILKSESSDNAAVWVCIPTIILEVPFVWNNVPEWLGTVVAIVFMLVVYLTFRKKFALSKISGNFKGLPVEMITLGMMYMIFSIL